MEYESRETLKNLLTEFEVEKELKTCSKCKINFSATTEFFHQNRTKKDGFDSWCKMCKKRYDKLYYQYKRYKVTKEDYEKMLKEQNGKCLICGRNFDEIYFPRNTHIDHDHKTGKVRALLCNNCNVILGNAFDNPLILVSAIK